MNISKCCFFLRKRQLGNSATYEISCSERQIQANQVRFYKSEQKLSDAGGGLKIFLNGKKVDQKGMMMGSMNVIADRIEEALAGEK